MNVLIKYISAFFIFVALTFTSSAQQVYQLSQYLQNLYLLNSATAGLHDYTEVNLSYRKQWIGINNSPTTYYVSVNTPVGKRIEINPKSSSVRISSPTAYNSVTRKSYHAVGGYLAQDAYGPYAMLIGSLSYTFHLPLSKDFSISFSPNVSYKNISFDQSKAKVEFSGDPTYDAYLGTRTSTAQMDINAAFWLYHPKFFVGYSSAQLVQDRLKFNDQITLEDLKIHHNLIASYNYKMTRNLTLTPSVLLRYVDQAPFAFDLNFRLDYQNLYWAGLSYRNSNSLVAMVGLYLSDTIRFGYAFDLGLTSIQTRNAGSHEVMIRLNLFNKEKAIF